MKITRYVHACLLVETKSGKVILVDPGQFSWESRLFDISSIPKLDIILITHEHFDHFYEPFIKSILLKFPEVLFVTTSSVAIKLQKMGAVEVSTESIPDVEIFSRKKHASLAPMGEAPENIAVHIDGKLTIGGDRHDLEETKKVLALTVTAPWGSMVDSAEMALRLKPAVIVPVHDWHWNKKARASAYKNLESLFYRNNIQFLSPTDGIVFEV